MLVGLIPAAGYARRLGEPAVSKEVLPVGGRPVMDFLLDRMRAARPDELRVVTRPEKRDVVEHARRTGTRVVLGHPPDVSASLLLGLDGLADDDELLVGFPDTLWEPADGFVRLLDRLRAGAELVLGVFRAPDPERSDVVTMDPDGRIRRIAVKPSRPESDLIWGCAATRVRTLRALRDHPEPGLCFDALARRGGGVAGVRLSDRWTDIGTPDALRQALRDQGPPALDSATAPGP
jgi:glucose-1-phosphate thymidylyltransferase